ncbi:MAG: LutC/YkgG family protein [Streptosporangiaceae bacterium]
MSAREEVLGRIRAALAGQPTPAPDAPADRADRPDRPDQGDGAGPAAGYRTGTDLTAAGLIGLLAERLADYGCAVRQCPAADLTDAMLAVLAGRGLRRVVLPPGLDLPGPDLPRLAEAARAAGIDLVPDAGFSTADLADFDGVLTTAALAIAETGTIVLDGSAGQGRRALSLVPDYHLCVLAADRIVGIVPEAIALLSPDRPLTWISGPSATSDIELDRVNGVHGPRTLDVIIVTRR